MEDIKEILGFFGRVALVIVMLFVAFWPAPESWSNLVEVLIRVGGILAVAAILLFAMSRGGDHS